MGVQAVDVGGGPPPMLRDVLELTLRRGRGLFIELKESGCEEEVVRLLLARDGAARAVNLISFHVTLLAATRAAGLPSETDVGLLYRDLPEHWERDAASIGATNIGLAQGAATAEICAAVARAGITLWVWNPRGEAEVRRAMQLDVAGMGSDDPLNSLACVNALT